MPSTPPLSRPTFMTPLSRDDLIDPGQSFPREELLRRVLPLFWRDCCHPAALSRAPAPVVELTPDAPRGAEGAYRVRAWWLLNDGIVEEADGPNADRLRLFFGTGERNELLWPRYEFRLRAEPFELEMSFQREPFAGRGHRTRLEHEPDGRVRVAARHPWWGK